MIEAPEALCLSEQLNWGYQRKGRNGCYTLLHPA